MPDDTYLKMLPLLKDLERRRRRYFFRIQRDSIILLGVAVVSAVLSGVAKMFEQAFFAPGVWGVVALTFGLLGIITFISHFEDSRFLRKYQDVFKTLLVPELLKTLCANARYDSGRGVSEKAFQSLSLFANSHDGFRSTDKITGSIDGVSFSISNVQSQIRVDAKDSAITQFEGFFLMLEFNKAFHGRTYVLPDKAERIFGRAGRSLQKAFKRKHTSLIQLDDSKFEKAFTVYSTDEVEARYILSHSMMARLLGLRERFGAGVRLSFRDNFVCIAIPTGRNFLEPEVMVSATDERQYYSIYRCLKMLLGIVDDLDLTTRIWSKH